MVSLCWFLCSGLPDPLLQGLFMRFLLGSFVAPFWVLFLLMFEGRCLLSEGAVLSSGWLYFSVGVLEAWVMF